MSAIQEFTEHAPKRSQRELLVAEGVPMRGERVDLDEARLPPEL